MRPARSPALIALLLLGGCASETTASVEPPMCSVDDEGRAGNGVLLMAQSVPTASFVPCLRSDVPLGWRFHHLDARDGSAVFSLDSDRDGVEALEVRLEADCDTRGATEIVSDRAGMRRMERLPDLDPHYVGQRHYLFDGGCLTFDFDLDGDWSGEALVLVAEVVDVVPRADLRAQVRADSGGRLDLDPAAGGEG